jgi:rhodanese-related sulfurtransferase
MADNETTPVPSISRDELRALVDSGQPFTLVETLPAMYYRHTHLLGALHLEPGDGWETRAAKLLPDKDAVIVVYCAGPT